MKVGEFKKIIEGLPDDMTVGGSGYWGEYIRIWDAYVQSVSLPYPKTGESEDILCIYMEDKGEPPCDF